MNKPAFKVFWVPAFFIGRSGMSNLKLPLHTLKGVGNKTEELFQHLHIDNLMDLLMYFPRDYQSFPMPVDHTSQLVVGQNAAITGIFRLRPVNRHFRSMDITIASLDTGHEKIDVISDALYFKKYTNRNSLYYLWKNRREEQ